MWLVLPTHKLVVANPRVLLQPRAATPLRLAVIRALRPAAELDFWTRFVLTCAPSAPAAPLAATAAALQNPPAVRQSPPAALRNRLAVQLPSAATSVAKAVS